MHQVEFSHKEVKKQLEDLFNARKEIQELDTPTKSEEEGSRMIMSEIDDKAKALSDKAKEGIMMADYRSVKQ